MYSFISTVQGVVSEVQALYDRIESVKWRLEDIGIDLGILPSLSLPAIVLPSLSFDWSLPTAEEIRSKLNSHLIELSYNVGRVLNKTQENVIMIHSKVESVAGKIEAIFDDYSPPYVNTSLLWDEFQGNQMEFLENVWRSVVNQTTQASYDLLKIVISRDYAKNAVVSFVPKIRDTVFSFFDTWTPKSFVPLEVDLSQITQQVENITKAAMIIDALYRILSLLRNILKIVSRGEMKPLLVGVSKVRSSPSFWTSIISFVLPLLPSLFVVSCIV